MKKRRRKVAALVLPRIQRNGNVTKISKSGSPKALILANADR
jgi:hypothetical protein